MATPELLPARMPHTVQGAEDKDGRTHDRDGAGAVGAEGQRVHDAVRGVCDAAHREGDARVIGCGDGGRDRAAAVAGVRLLGQPLDRET